MGFYYIDDGMPHFKWLYKVEGDFAFIGQVSNGRAVFIEKEAFKAAKHAILISADQEIEDVYILDRVSFQKICHEHDNN